MFNVKSSLSTDIEAEYMPLMLLITKTYINKKFSKGQINYRKSFKTISLASFTKEEGLEVSGEISGCIFF